MKIIGPYDSLAILDELEDYFKNHYSWKRVCKKDIYSKIKYMKRKIKKQLKRYEKMKQHKKLEKHGDWYFREIKLDKPNKIKIMIPNKKYDYHKKLNTLCVIRNSISLICFTILAIVFKKWWIVLFSILFYASVGKDDK